MDQNVAGANFLVKYWTLAIMYLATVPARRRKRLFFESGEQKVHLGHSQASGNPVKIGDGYATVTGYKPPAANGKFAARATGLSRTGKAGARL
jgi:hypothetical protein